MICPSCLKDNENGARFCAFCGAEIPSAALDDLAAGDDGAQVPETPLPGPLPMPPSPPMTPVASPPSPEQAEAEHAITNLLAEHVEQVSNQAEPSESPAPPTPPAPQLPTWRPTLSNEFPLPPPPPPTKTRKVSCTIRGCCGCLALIVGIFVALMVIGFYAEKSDLKKGANPATKAILEGTVGSVHVSDVRLSKHIDKNDEPVELTDELTSPTDTEVYVHFHWTGATGSTVFQGQLFCAGEKDDDYDTELPVKDAEGSGFFHYTWKGGFNPGQYLTKILVGDQVVCQIPFIVTGQQDSTTDSGKTAPAINTGPIDPWAGATFATVALNQKWGKALPVNDNAFSAAVGPTQDQGDFQVQVGWNAGLLAITRVSRRNAGGIALLPDAYAAAKPGEPNRPGKDRAVYVAAHIPGFSLDPAFIQVAKNDPNWTHVSLTYENATMQGVIQLQWTTDSKYEVVQAYNTKTRPKSGGAWNSIPDPAATTDPALTPQAGDGKSEKLIARWANAAIIRVGPQGGGSGDSYVLCAFDPDKSKWEKLKDSSKP